MYRFTGLSIIVASIIALSLIVMGGCSSSQSNPVTGLNESPDISLPVNNESFEDSNHNLSGMWTATFDTQTLTATIAPDRILNAHWNVTSLLPTPLIAVTGYDPITEVIEVDVTITNPFAIDAYDVRLIIFTDSTGNRLMNADNWTALYDIPGGLPVNPFKAYEADVDYRIFEGLSEHTCDLSIHIPGGNASITFAIDASYPDNCEEPYRIRLSEQLDKLLDQTGSSALMIAWLHDHQGNSFSVELYCPAITGEILVPFSRATYNWELELVNATGASEGEYQGWILAKSDISGSLALYEPITIEVYPAGQYPYDPEVIGKYDPFYYDTFDVCLQGDYAYVLESYYNHKTHVKIVNISDPANPVPMGLVSQDQPPFLAGMDLVVQGDYLYVIDTIGGLYVADISDPWNPVIISQYYIGEMYYHMDIKGDYVYVMGMSHLLIIDVTDPTDPQSVEEISISGCHEIDVQGDYLYVASSRHFYVYDITDPSSPIEVGDLDVGPYFSGIWISVYGDYAFIIDSGSEFKLLNISDPTNPYEVAHVENLGGGHSVEMVGDYAYVSCWYDGVEVYDLSNPSAPVLASTIDTTKAQDVAVDGDYIYLADTSGGLRIFDVTNPAVPIQTGRIKKAYQKHIDVVGDYAYVADDEYGCTIYDISDSESPQILVSYDLPKTTDIKVIGDYAYIIGKKFLNLEYLFVMDFSDPFNPVEIGSVSLGYITLESLLIESTYAYICTFDDGLKIVDISVPGSPALVSTVNVPDTRNAAIEGDFAYVASFDDGLFVVDISDPTNPEITGSVMTENHARDVAVKGDYAYVANYGCLTIVNISNPDDPQYITNIDLPGASTAHGVYISGDYVYVAHNVSGPYVGPGMTVVDISDPGNPEVFSNVVTGGYVGGNNNDVQVIDNIAYLVDIAEGLKIVELWQ